MTRRRVGLGLAAFVVVAVVLNVAGVLRYPGGPLREPSADAVLWLDIRPPDQGSNRVGLSARSEVGPGVPIYTSIDLGNESPWPATVEQIRLLGLTPGLRLIDAKLAVPGRTGSSAGLVYGDGAELDELQLDTGYRPIPADLAAHNAIGEGTVSIVVTADNPGEYEFQAVAVDYRIGPFAFTVVHHQAFGGCFVPMPEGTSCSADEER